MKNAATKTLICLVIQSWNSELYSALVSQAWR